MNMVANLVLLVDDNDTDNFIHKRVIELLGFSKHVEVCNSGRGALNYLKSHAHIPDMIPDLVFLDINMPVVDGFVFLHEFACLSHTVQQKTRIIILSSSDNKRDIDKITSNPFVAKFIIKPLTEEALRHTAELFRQQQV